MKRKLLIAVLALGTVGGFTAGFASMRCRAKWRRNHLEQKVTNICADAIKKAQAEQ